MNTDLHFSSKSNEWETPQEFFDKLDKEFNFVLDAAATKDNTKCPHFIGIEEDSLQCDWKLRSFNGENQGSIFVNPPYSRSVSKFVKKGYEESLKGVTVVMLVPARTDTKWWHEYCTKGEVRFIKGRLKFSRKDEKGNVINNPAPFPSAVVIFHPLIGPKTRYVEQ